MNQIPLAVKSFTDEDLHAITPNDLLLGRSRNVVPWPRYDHNDSLTKRQETLREMEQLWWDQWIVKVFPNLVPYKQWRTEKRTPKPNDIVLVLYDKKVGK